MPRHARAGSETMCPASSASQGEEEARTARGKDTSEAGHTGNHNSEDGAINRATRRAATSVSDE